ncbi:MAG TPA: MFS transporter [Drouetiella sp.]
MQAAWKNRNLQLYFGGQLVSLVGTWMQQMAMSWLVYRLTNSPMMLGLIGFTSQAPSLVLTPFAGIIADRANRHQLILITQILAMLQAAVLAALVWTGRAELWELIVLSAFLGCVTAFDLTARQTFMVDMLDDPEQLSTAIGINSSLNTITRLIGPFVAGIFVAWAGEGICFVANAVSYLAVIVALLFVKSNRRVKPATDTKPMDQLKEGFLYVCGNQPIRLLIVLLALIGLFAMPFALLMPAFAKDVFHGNAETLGYLTGASSAGSVVAAFLLTSRRKKANLGSLIIMGCAVCGLSLVAFGFCRFLPLSLLAVAFAGFGSMIVMAGSNTLIQMIVDEDKRGRVMSFVVMAFLGLAPFGCMIAGALANKIGVGNTTVLAGICTALLAVFFRANVTGIKQQVVPSLVDAEIGVTEADEELALAKV